jgi:hypothetical protein
MSRAVYNPRYIVVGVFHEKAEKTRPDIHPVKSWGTIIESE